MGRQLDDRFQAGFINGFINVCLLTLVLMLLWRGFPSLANLRGAPWWAYLAGAIGASIVVIQLSAAPILGAALLVALFVAGQIVGSMTVDTLGIVGYPVRTPSGMRIFALCLILFGVVLAAVSMGGDSSNVSTEAVPEETS